MKVLVKGSTGEQVKILQALINDGSLAINGVFDANTDRRLRSYQASKGLVVDGSCGPATWKSLYFQPSKYSNLYVMKIPFANIVRTDVLLKDKNFGYNVGKFASEYKSDIVINAAMFDMKTRQNVTDLVVNGKLNNGGNYTDKGIGFENNRGFQSNTSNCVNKPSVDFIGGAPLLVWYGAKNVDMKGLGASFYNQITQRMAIGVDNDNLFIITTGQANKSNLETITQEFLYQKAITAIDLDGGGSTAMAIRGKTVFTANRNIPSVLGVDIKNMSCIF